MRHGFYAFLVFAAGASYGVLSTFVKLAYGDGFTVSDVSGGPCFLGAVLLWVLALMKRFSRPGGKVLLFLAASGCLMAGTTMFYYQALTTLSASLAVVFLFQSIWIGTVLDAFLKREFPSPWRLFSIVMALGGTILASGALAEADFHFSSGMIWGFLAACSYASFITVSTIRIEGITPIAKSAFMTSADMIVTFLILPPLFLTDTAYFLDFLPWAAFLSLFGIVLPPILLSWGMPHIGPGLGSLLTAAELPTALLMSSLVLGESMELFQWLGILCIFGGILAGNLEEIRKRKNSGE